MEKKLFDNTISNLKSAINLYLKLKIDNKNIDKIKELCETLIDFPDTLFQFLNNLVLNSNNISSYNKLSIIEFIDGEKNSLGIKINEKILIHKFKLYEQFKKFDEIIRDIKKYELENNILDLKLKEEFLILILRVYTKNHSFGEILKLNSITKKNINKFTFDDNQKNKYYNYLARAYAYSSPKTAKALMYLDKARKIESSYEIEIRNFRYTTLCYWKIGDKKCAKIAEEGIKFIDTLGEKEKYKKYYSDLNRLLGASKINEGKYNDAFIYSERALEVIDKENNYHYEKFWINFLKCTIFRLQNNCKEALLVINQLENNNDYIKTITRHPEAKYKLNTEKLKIQILEKNRLDKVITELNSSTYKGLIDNSWGIFYRYLMLAEANYYAGNHQNAKDYIGTARIFNDENDRDYLNSKKFITLKNLIENGK